MPAQIKVSSALLQSMLVNRHKSPREIAKEVATKADFAALLNEDTEIDFDDLTAIAAYFKKPWSYFLQEKKETIPDIGHDNRTQENQKIPISGEMIDTLQSAELLIETAMELFPSDKFQRPRIELSTHTEPESIALKIREFLGITLSMQLECKDEYAALRMWIEALQSKGVYIAQRKLPDATIRAFSVNRNSHALIVISTGDQPYARIFSLLHEYCHLLLRNTGICDLTHEHNSLERYCNNFASSVLLPPSLIIKVVDPSKFTDELEENEKLITSWSHRLRVSQAALLIKLNALGIIDDPLYHRLESRRQHSRRASGGGGDYYTIASNAVGRRFAEKVFGALSDGNINRTDASVLLGVGEHLVDKFKNKLFNAPSPNE